MSEFILRAVISALGLAVAAHVVPGVKVTNIGTLAVAAILLGLVNAIVKPIFVLLTFPLTILTLGLFLFVVNGLMLWLVAYFLKGFTIAGLWPAILGSIVVSLVSWVASAIILN
jgi:putative membrane protein